MRKAAARQRPAAVLRSCIIRLSLGIGAQKKRENPAYEYRIEHLLQPF